MLLRYGRDMGQEGQACDQLASSQGKVESWSLPRVGVTDVIEAADPLVMK